MCLKVVGRGLVGHWTIWVIGPYGTLLGLCNCLTANGLGQHFSKRREHERELLEKKCLPAS